MGVQRLAAAHVVGLGSRASPTAAYPGKPRIMSRLTRLNNNHSHTSQLPASKRPTSHCYSPCITHCRIPPSQPENFQVIPCFSPRTSKLSIAVWPFFFSFHCQPAPSNSQALSHKDNRSTQPHHLASPAGDPNSRHAAMAARVNISARFACRRTATHSSASSCHRRPRLFSTSGASVDKVTDTDIATLARQTQHPLSLADLVK